MAKMFSDFHVRQSTLDKNAVRKIVLEVKPDMIITACTDQALLIAAELSEEFNLFFPLSAIQAKELTNKRYMKDVMVKSGIRTAKNIVLDSFDKHQLEGLSLPLVFKPVDSNSSKGVIKVLSKNDFERCYEFSRSFSRSGEVICEEFIEGVEISIDGYVRNGEAIQLMTSVSEKLSGNRNNFPICRSIIPAPISEMITREINTILQQIVYAFFTFKLALYSAGLS
jgi:formate-dependent phosphoribosylglycinamide formyltransferase (GAR transformylase)